MLLVAPQYKASLRIKHPSLDPGEISLRLGLEPTFSWKKGDPRATPMGSPLPGNYPYSYWCYRIPTEPGIGLNECLQSIASTLAINDDFLLKVSEGGGDGEIYLTINASLNAGDEINWSTLRDLARLKITLALEVFPTSQN